MTDSYAEPHSEIVQPRQPAACKCPTLIQKALDHLPWCSFAPALPRNKCTYVAATLSIAVLLVGTVLVRSGSSGPNDHDKKARELGNAASISLLASGQDPDLLTCGVKFADLQQQREDLASDDMGWFSMGCLPAGSEDHRMIADAWDLHD